MKASFLISTIIGITLLCLANTYKISIKPKVIPCLFPLWFCSIFVFLVSAIMDKKKKIYDMNIWIISLVILAYSYLTWKNYQTSNVLEASLSEPSTIVFICILSKIFLGTKITKIRISALFIITIGVILPVLFSKNMSNINFYIVFKHIMTNFIFSCVNMFYEIGIKRKVNTIWEFLFTSNLFILCVSSIFIGYDVFLNDLKKTGFLTDSKVYCVSLYESYSLIYNSMLVFTFNPVPRTLLRLLISLLSGLYEGLFIRNSVKKIDVSSLLIVAFGVLLYNTDYFSLLLEKNKKIKLENQSNISETPAEEFEKSIVIMEESSC